MYHEVTSSTLVCVDLEGNIIDPGSTQLGVNEEGLALHSAIHKARRNIKCVIHIYSNAGVAVRNTPHTIIIILAKPQHCGHRFLQ